MYAGFSVSGTRWKQVTTIVSETFKVHLRPLNVASELANVGKPLLQGEPFILGAGCYLLGADCDHIEEYWANYGCLRGGSETLFNLAPNVCG